MKITQIHTELSQWQKDLDFLDLERRFLKKIIKDYLSDSGLISQKVISDFKERLDQLGLDIHALRTDIVSSHTKIELIIKNAIDENWKEIEEEQLILQDRHNDLFSSFRRFKAELFDVTGQIIEEEAID